MTPAAPLPAPPGVPSLRRLWLPVLAGALAAHAAVASLVLLTNEPVAAAMGGGDRVVGRLSIALGAPVPEPDVPVPDPATARAAPEPEPAQPVAAPSMPAPAPAPVPVPVPAPASIPASIPPEPAPRDTAPARAEPDPAPSAEAARAAAATPGEGASAPLPGATGGTEAASDRMDAYLARIRELIERERLYPRSARRQGIEGTATVRLTIAGSGTLAELSLSRSSGSPSLDRAARRMVSEAAPFPAPPSQAAYTIALPIVFALD